MLPQLLPEDQLLQIARLQRLMQEADGEWEELTRAIQTDQKHLANVQQHLEQFHLVLALPDEHSPRTPPALAKQAAALQQQMAQLKQQIIIENARRSAVTQQFEQARLSLAALRRHGFRKSQTSVAPLWNFLVGGIKRFLHGLWLALQSEGSWSGVIPPADLLRDRSNPTHGENSG